MFSVLPQPATVNMSYFHPIHIFLIYLFHWRFTSYSRRHTTEKLFSTTFNPQHSLLRAQEYLNDPTAARFLRLAGEATPAKLCLWTQTVFMKKNRFSWLSRCRNVVTLESHLWVVRSSPAYADFLSGRMWVSGWLSECVRAWSLISYLTIFPQGACNVPPC